MCIRDSDYSDVDLNMESIRLYRYLQHNVVPVSYTHLDVYKRQVLPQWNVRCQIPSQLEGLAPVI